MRPTMKAFLYVCAFLVYLYLEWNDIVFRYLEGKGHHYVLSFGVAVCFLCGLVSGLYDRMTSVAFFAGLVMALLMKSVSDQARGKGTFLPFAVSATVIAVLGYYLGKRLRILREELDGEE